VAGLELTEFVLLVCDFHVLGEMPNGGVSPSEEPEIRASSGESEPSRVEDESMSQPPSDGMPDDSQEADWKTLELHGANLRYTATAEENEFVLLVHLLLTDPTAPYELNVVTGSRFTAPDDPPVALEEAETTLVFITYPYLREVVSNITSRSPYREFTLRPLTRLPHPRVRGEENDGSEDIADG
jgi:hypothetical protein